jgi:hypothetical protein
MKRKPVRRETTDRHSKTHRSWIHPATTWNQVRHHAFSVFEKTGDIDKAAAVIFRHSVPRQDVTRLKAVLLGELLYYDAFRKELKLEPLLDAGGKADFGGIRSGQLVNVDVTTNLDYKNIDDYAQLSKKRGKIYELACVNLKTSEIESFPLRFPVCPKCQKTFSHYILFLNEPEGSLYTQSQYQELHQYCPNCEYWKLKDSYNYLVSSPLINLDDEMGYQSSEEFRDPKFDKSVFLAEECAPIVRFFQKTKRPTNIRRCGNKLSHNRSKNCRWRLRWNFIVESSTRKESTRLSSSYVAETRNRTFERMPFQIGKFFG